MGREQTFLRRLSAGPGLGSHRRHQPTTTENVEELRESVRLHLARLLNARHGMSQAVPDYGLPSLVDLTTSSGDCASAMTKAIRTAIEKYEPRLRHVRVSCLREEDVPTQRALAFRVDAVMVGRDGEYGVGYVTAVSPSGQLEVAD
jgi:type VI secretion system protein